MSIRMIAIDLDGTLLHDDMTISAYSREVIQRAIQKGYEIVVATGRMWDSARSKVALLRLGNVPVICYTGAWIMWSEAASVPFWRAVSERRSPSSIRGMISSMCIKRASIKHRLSLF